MVVPILIEVCGGILLYLAYGNIFARKELPVYEIRQRRKRLIGAIAWGVLGLTLISISVVLFFR